MADLYLDFGGDLRWGPGGNLLMADGLTRTNQRLVRRYCTNPQRNDSAGNVVVPPDYIFHPGYGGGVRQLVDDVVNDQAKQRIQQMLVAQTRLEASVAQFPPAVVTLRSNGPGEVDAFVQYTTASGAPGQTGFSITQ